MNQGELFDNREPLARSGDEVTSHIAAAKLTESGQRSSQKGQLLKWVRTLAPSEFFAITSAEIAVASGLRHPSVHKRLPDLLRDGHVKKWYPRVCRVTGNTCVTWYAVTR